jgi:saccharopine dehydrogenase-like NADP-dependent oxidoreductase
MLGAGAVGTVSALKFAQEAMLEKLVIADAVSARASLLADRLSDLRVTAMTLDAGDRAAVARTIRETGSTMVLNATLPVTNIEVMRACLEAGCDYIDLASGGTDADGVPKLDDQFALDAEFRAAGRLALLGMGADPGTTNVYAAYAAKHLLDGITEIRVRDGDNSVCQGHDGFVAAFSPWVFIDECLCKAVSYRDEDETRQIDILQISHEVETTQNARLAAFKANRDPEIAEAALETIRTAARNDDNIMPSLVEGALANCTLGEMVQALADVYGRYTGGPEW